MANFLSGEDYLFATNPHSSLTCDPTTTSHGTEEPFLSYPKISKVWSMNNPNNLLTPQPVVEEGEMEGRDEPQEEDHLPLPPLRHKVQLPSRASFLANGVHQLVELILQYGDLEEHVLMIDIHGDMMELPIQKQNEPEIIPISENPSVPINSFPSFPSPILNQGEGLVEASLINPLPPPPRKKISALRRKLKCSKTCQICHKKFANKSDAARHSFVHLSQEEKEAVKEGWKYKCYFCSKRFQTPSLLDRHLIFHTKEKPHPCPKCRKQFPQESNLTRHQRQSFTTNQNLTRHVNMVHLQLKQFHCPECDDEFATKDNLLRHLNAIHLGIRYPCRKPHCGKTFSFEVGLRQHEKTAH